VEQFDVFSLVGSRFQALGALGTYQKSNWNFFVAHCHRRRRCRHHRRRIVTFDFLRHTNTLAEWTLTSRHGGLLSR